MSPEPAGSEGDDAPLAGLYPRALVTGGSGFIGSHVVRRLLDEGVAVRCLLLPGDAAPSLAGLDVERVVGDVTDRAAVTRAAAGCDVVFNLAAIYAIWLPRPRRMYEVNVGGAVAVVEGARAAGVRRVVHTSSIAAIGHLPGRELADETTRFNDWELRDDYVLSKYISECEALARGGDGLDVVCVNPAFPFGDRDVGPTPTGRMIADALAGRLPFVIAGGFNAVDVRDVAEGHLLAARRGRPGERYILGGENVTFRDFGALVARRAGRRPPLLTLPTRAMLALGSVAGAIADHVTHAPPRFTRPSVAYLAGRYAWFSTAKAERDLGYSPRPIEHAIDASIAWFRGHPT